MSAVLGLIQELAIFEPDAFLVTVKTWFEMALSSTFI
jgi:hypothetical protein